MRHSLKTGLSFGLTSGIITTLGLMIGLYAGTQSKLAVLGGILTIALADAFSDALGIHISKEAENKHTTREIWESTFFTFMFKFVVASTFLVPVILLPLWLAVIVSGIWGFILLGLFSLYLAQQEGEKPWKVIAEHILVAILVILASFYIGKTISSVFG